MKHGKIIAITEEEKIMKMMDPTVCNIKMV